MAKTHIILIDFDNVFKKELNEYSDYDFGQIFNSLILIIQSKFVDIKEIRIRLYGGWFRHGILTSKASTLQQRLSSLALFPYITSTQRIGGTIELATSLYFLPDVTWTHTLREKEGIPKLRINFETLPENCVENQANCPAFLLRKFTKHKDKICNGNNCDLTNSQVFTGLEQKMVDTMIACDLMSFTSDEDILSVNLFSDDLDLMPPLGYASTMKQYKNENLSIAVYIKNNRLIELIREILSPFTIKIYSYE